MSELQIGLLAIGAVVVAGVLVYNRLQERGARSAAERAFRSQHADALLDSPAPGAAQEPAEPARPALHRAPEPQPQPQAEPDPAVDYIVEFSAAQPGAQAAVNGEWPAIERRHARRA